MRVAFTHNLMTSSSEAQAEFDTPETVALICSSLRRLGHEVHPVEVSGSLATTVARLEELRPDLVFNTAEGSTGRFRESFQPALFEELGLAFVGSDAYVCALTLDKSLTKSIVAARGVSTPPWALVQRVEELDQIDLPFPVIVKPNYEGSSKGITADSVVSDPAALRVRATELLASYPDGVLVECYISGLDVVVPFIEGASPDTGGVLEPASYSYDPELEARPYQIYDLDMKQSGFDGLRICVPAQISPVTRSQVIEQSQIAFRALGVRDLGRIDFRVGVDGTPYFLEVNALPSLEAGASIYLCGEPAGVSGTDAVLRAVLASATRRQGVLALPSRVSVA